MSERDSTSESASGQLNITLTPDEKRIFGQLFQAADSEGLGVVTGELAVKFFEKSGLSPQILGEIWGIADTENRGLLTKVGFSVALRLIGQAQAGNHPRPELALNPGPLPRFEGLSNTFPAPPTTSSPPPPQVQASPTRAGLVRVPQLTEADCKKFTELFQVSGAVDGVLPGDAAKQIFTRAKLPNQTLGLIWNLADRHQKGALTCPEFVVAMHLINCTKLGTLQALPPALPPGLYEAACGRPVRGPAKAPPGRGVPPNIPPPPPTIQKQFSGSGVRAQSPLSRQYTPPAPLTQTISGGTSGGEWAISSREKAEFDALFNTVDRGGKGYITGEEAVPFFSNSKLPEDVLATIWDLADITKAGRLSQDEFAIAMYLIRQQRTRRDGKGLPETLPPNLVPPSMRAQFLPQPAPPPPPPPPPPQQASSSLEDLFGLDSFGPTPTTAPPQNPSIGGQSLNPYDIFKHQTQETFTAAANAGTAPLSAPLFTLPQSNFVPQSEFGQRLAASGTGTSTSSMPRTTSAMEDLLGDNDPEVNKKITPDTMELANLSNQIGTLTKQTQELKNKRASTEQERSALDTQKRDIEVRLAQIKSLYEREAKDFAADEARLNASRTETARLRQEYALAEASYNELQAKKQEVASQLEQDKRENQELKERMGVVNAENQQMKQQLEKLQQDAKQAKRLVTISKQQLATSEAERDKLKSEIEEARSAAAAASAGAVPVPGSPTPSQASGITNPFHRGRSPAVPEAAYQSPYATGNSTLASNQNTQPQSSYEYVFGPAFGSSSAGSAPPVSFGQGTPSAPSASEGQLEHSTPPTSPPVSSYHNSPQTFDVPPPASGSQITSVFLPLHLNRAESATSSVQVNPATSVHESNASRPDTPTNWVTGPSSSGDKDPFSNDERRGSTSVRSDPGTESRLPGFSRNDDNKSPFAPVTLAKSNTGPTTGEDIFKKGHEKKDSFGFTTNLPGAFSPPIKPTATGESTMSNKSRGSTMNKPEVTFAPRPDPFNLVRGEEKAPSASKEDMDLAFGSFGPPKAHLQERQDTGGSAMSSTFNKEFPPIQELPQDDESDSDVGGGFDDDFTTASPVQSRTVPPTTSAPPDGPDFSSKPGTPLPGANDQPAPPGYSSAKPESASDKNPFPQEFKGLLPSRTDPLSHDVPTPGGSLNAVLYPTSEPPAGSSTSPPPSQMSLFPNPPTTAPSTSKPTVDDFDDDVFRDLADAREVDGKGENDDFGVLAVNDNIDDFNDIFDSPHPKVNTTTTGKSAHTDDDDFTKFDFNIDTPATTQQQQLTGASTSSVPRPVASSEDWDAIFAGSGIKTNEGGANTGTEREF